MEYVCKTGQSWHGHGDNQMKQASSLRHVTQKQWINIQIQVPTA